MSKKLMLLIGVAVLGAAVAKKLRVGPEDAVAPATPRAPRIVAETLEPEPEPAPEAEPAPEPEPEPAEERHALRPSPVPRERPVWSPPTEGTGSGRHAAREPDENG